VVLSLVWEALLGGVPQRREYETALASAGITRPTPAPPGETRILVVDDDLEVQETIVAFLDSRGYRTSVAGDGLTAIRTLTTEPADVILLDIQMAGLSGDAALPTIRAMAPRAAVIMVTANIDRDTARRTLAQGAFDYLVKPVNFRHLAKSIQMAIEVKALDDAAEARSAPAAAPTNEPAPSPPSDGSVAAPAATPWTTPTIKRPERRVVGRRNSYGGVGSPGPSRRFK
jgi:CheY-like chemotaxis protein